MENIGSVSKTVRTLPMDTAVRTAEPAGTAASASAKKDKLTLSQQAKAMLEEYQRRQAALKAEQERAEQMKEAGKQQADALAKSLKTRLLCWKIAARIMDGDKVPPEDERFLLNNDPAGYQMAMSLRKLKEDPEDYDSLLEDEEESSQSGGSVEGVSGETACTEGGEAAAEVSVE